MQNEQMTEEVAQRQHEMNNYVEQSSANMPICKMGMDAFEGEKATFEEI